MIDQKIIPRFVGVAALLAVVFLFNMPEKVYAFGECSQYGTMVRYDYLSDSCECMSGYVMHESYGRTQCVSMDSICKDRLGFQSRYNTLTDSCECIYGYVMGEDSLGRTQCMSQSSYCTNTLGFNSRYNTLSNSCECWDGYVLDGGRCVDGNTFCLRNHGIYAEYNSLGERCECKNGYTLDDSSQCVKKQNNAYFRLEQLNSDDRKAIIKSEYDYGYYLISYGAGCFGASFSRYVNQDIVVNLGTDFDVDMWDSVVLQDDDKVCDITHVERVDSDATLYPEEEDSGRYAYVGTDETQERYVSKDNAWDDSSPEENNSQNDQEIRQESSSSWFDSLMHFFKSLF